MGREAFKTSFIKCKSVFIHNSLPHQYIISRCSHIYDRQADQEASGDDQAEHHVPQEQRDGGEEEVYPSK